MKCDAIKLPDGWRPVARIELTRDPRGNWFASLERLRADGGPGTLLFTATHTDPREAASEAIERGLIRE